MMDTGTAMAGISVARALRRNRNTTPVTRPTAISKVISVSCRLARIVVVRSMVVSRSMSLGMAANKCGIAAFIAVHGIDDVGAGLAKHDSENRRLALRNSGMSDVFDRIQNVRHVGQPHGGVVAIGDDKRLVIGRAGRLVIGIKLIVQRRCVDGPFRAVGVRRRKCGPNIFQPDAVFEQRGRVQLHAHAREGRATDDNLTDAADAATASATAHSPRRRKAVQASASPRSVRGSRLARPPG